MTEQWRLDTGKYSLSQSKHITYCQVNYLQTSCICLFKTKSTKTSKRYLKIWYGCHLSFLYCEFAIIIIPLTRKDIFHDGIQRIPQVHLADVQILGLVHTTVILTNHLRYLRENGYILEIPCTRGGYIKRLNFTCNYAVYWSQLIVSSQSRLRPISWSSRPI